MSIVRRVLRLFSLPYDDSDTHNNNMANETGDRFIPSPTDVLDVKSTLWQKGLPAELVDSVVEFAEYWPRFVVEAESTENPLVVRNNGNVLYLQSQPLPGSFTLGSSEEEEAGKREELVIGGVEVRTTNPARKIVFRISSHDQGWSSNRGRGMFSSSLDLLVLFRSVL